MTTSLRDIAHDVQRDNPHLGSKTGVEQTLKAAFDVILERVAKGDQVTIRGFGAFHAKMFSGRTLSSPLMKGGSIQFSDQLVLRFRQSQSAKQNINEIAAAQPKKTSKKGTAKSKANGKKGAAKASAKKKSNKKGAAKKAASKGASA